eukprot:CAMPEP_0168212706 /NCGR_PEP_ID=MMETSP0140_2-20121125/4409_1 /TAXON_ID=44445 /ORGANISM="Pseudo-nitzschia australis, Strain 10249 10 AB" /LENGTH=502 /DNA_ID=CAMNT_0008139517 /DNA_START=107 /DNA_END=1615 /DNA_ORIENTATION=+
MTGIPEPKQPQQQQQEQQQSNDAETITSCYNREEEYRLAQQASAEAVIVGRETLQTAVQQGEQLQNAEQMVDDTEYTLDKANRLLRGMTWSGWLANKFSKEVDSPEYEGNGNSNNDSERKSILGPPTAYEMVPESCRAAAQAVQNYHLNLQVLENCESDEQKGTCRLICDGMHRQARLKITEVLAGAVVPRKHGDAASSEIESGNGVVVDEDGNLESFALQLQEETQKLRHRQLLLQQMQQRPRTTTMTTATTGDDRAKLFNKTTVGSNTMNTPTKHLTCTDKVTMQQDEHLSTIAQHLQELGSLAGNLNISLQQQSEVLDSLDTKSETLQFKANTMNRRTDRFLKDKSWGQRKPDFLHYAWIKHQPSGRYLSVAPNNNSTLVLSNVLNERSIFGVYKKQRVLGLQNKYSRKWMGQNLLGQLTCSANAFNRREEWEPDGDDWSDTTLLIVSAGWGHGGYLLLDEGMLPFIGGGDISTKRKAPKWCISQFDLKAKSKRNESIL